MWFCWGKTYLEYERDGREWYEPDLRRRLSIRAASMGDRRRSGDRPRFSVRRSRFRDVDRSFLPKLKIPNRSKMTPFEKKKCVKCIPVDRPRSRLSDELWRGDRRSIDRRRSPDRDLRLGGDSSAARRSFLRRSFSFIICSNAANGSSMIPGPILLATP